jgi:hypothetical protein
MSLRGLVVAIVCLAWSWAGSVNSVEAQTGAKPANTDKLVRVTYPVADLVVPIPGFPGSDKKDTAAAALIQVLTNSIAKESWSRSGGAGTIEFFPFGMALVVNQTQGVHQDIARLLAELRRLAEIQVSVEVRAVDVSASMAKHLLLDIDEHGKQVRTIRDAGKGAPHRGNRAVSMDDDQIVALLNLARSDKSSNLTQPPKLTLFNAQQARLSTTRTEVLKGKPAIVDGLQCDVLPVVDPDQKFVRMTLNLQHYTPKASAPSHVTQASHTFVLPPSRTLVWHLGETTERRHLFILATPCAVAVKDVERIFPGELEPTPARGGTEEPEPNKLITPRAERDQHSPRELGIEFRLRQPISLNFKNVPFNQAIKDLANVSGVVVVPDTVALKEGRVNLDVPVSIRLDNVSMKSALNLWLAPLGLRWIIQDEVVIITTPEKGSQTIRKRYYVGDLIEAMARAAGSVEKADLCCESLKEVIQNTVAKGCWEAMGGRGTIQFFPREKVLVVSHEQAVHEEIDLLLANLRKMSNPSVNVETCFVQVSAGTAKRWRHVLGDQGKIVDIADSPKSKACASIDEKQMFMLLQCAQADRTATITQTPKLILLNGQHGRVGQMDQKASGWQCDLQTVVSPDRRTIRLAVDLEHRANDELRSIERLTKAAKTFNVSDGRTLVWDLGAAAGNQHLFVLVTPRIQVRPEDERLFLGEATPIPGR